MRSSKKYSVVPITWKSLWPFPATKNYVAGASECGGATYGLGAVDYALGALELSRR